MKESTRKSIDDYFLYVLSLPVSDDRNDLIKQHEDRLINIIKLDSEINQDEYHNIIDFIREKEWANE